MQMSNREAPGSIKNWVYKKLKIEIIMAKYKPGEVLNMQELTTSMRISSAPLREALNMLHRDGFVVLSPHKKTIVSPVSVKDYDAIMELRLLIEPYAAMQSVGKIPRYELREMRERLDELLKRPDDMYTFVETELAFHHLIHQYAGFNVFSDMLVRIKEHSMRIRYYLREAASSAKSIHLLTLEHLNILDTIESGDPSAVYHSVREHMTVYYEPIGPAGGILETFYKEMPEDLLRQALRGLGPDGLPAAEPV